jgi:hypothetical protein
VKVVVLRVTDDAHDLEATGLPFERELPSERTRRTEVVAGHRLVDDSYRRPVGIAGLEVASGNERRRERLEVVRRDGVEANAPAVLATLNEPVDVDKQAACRTGHRGHRGVRGGTHTWNQHQPFEQLLRQRCERRQRGAAVRAIQLELQNRLTRKSDADRSRRPPLRQPSFIHPSTH